MRKSILLVTGFLLLSAFSLRANDIYIAQSAVGAANGADCADAFPYSFFNSSSNWPSPIGPGTVVHICGTITAAAGTSGLLNFRGSGTAASPITLKFESGGVLQAPYWGQQGAISASGLNYLLVDGGTNGIITATANGTNLAYQVNSGVGISFNNVSNSEIKNMTISNIYVHSTSPNDTNGSGADGIYWPYGSYVTIDYNTIHDAYACIAYVWQGSGNTNVSIHNNTAFNCNWSINAGTGGNNAALSNLYIYGNTVHDWQNWDTTGNNFHHDGIFTFASAPGASIVNEYVYNNICYGSLSTVLRMTGCLYISADTAGGYGTITNAWVFNNVFGPTSPGTPADGYIFDWSTNSFIVNNTVVGLGNSNSAGTAYMQYGNGSTVYNNVLSSCATGVSVNSGASVAASDYNNFYNCADVGALYPNFFTTLALWQAAASFDAHSNTGNPNLNSSSNPPYQLSAGSGPAYRTGTNLSSYCSKFAALCTDAAGNPRPATGAWDMGAYQSQSTTSNAPNPPTGLTATVN